MPHKPKTSGFTLLEILLVVGIIAILAGIVIVAINPARQLATVRDTERKSDIKQVYNAMTQFYIDNGYYPASTTLAVTLAEICDTGDASSTEAVTCPAPLVNLTELVPTYITAIPTDPQGSTLSFIPKVYATANGTGYKVGVDPSNKLVLTAPQAELTTVAIGTSTATTTASACDATCLALREGLVGYWPFDADVADYSGSNIVTTNYGGVINSSYGKVNNGIYLETGTYIDGGNPDEVNFTAVPFSVSAWVKTSQNSWTFVVDKGNSGGLKNYDLMYDGSTGDIMFLWYSGWENNMGAFYSGGLSSPNDWHYIVGTWDGTYAKIYADGQLKVTSDDISDYQPTAYSENLFFGARRGSYNDYYLNGNLDEVSIWNRALDADEVSDLYNGGNGRSLINN